LAIPTKLSKILEVHSPAEILVSTRLIKAHLERGERIMAIEKCPVCDWAINDGGIKVEVAGKEVTVCCDECVEKVKENPQQYAASAA
jgi:hypothetical protein